MASAVVIPQMGESVVEATISKWLKKEGDPIKRDEPLVEIMTDKINAEIPAHKSGVMGKILVGEGTVVPIGAQIAWILEPGESVPTDQTRIEVAPRITVAQVPGQATLVSSQPVDEEPEPLKTSPAVRRLAKEFEVDLSFIKGTGGGGRITKEDVLAYVESRRAGIEAVTQLTPAKPAVPPAPRPVVPGELEEVAPFTGVRKIIADHMSRSKYTATHYTTFDEVDCTKLVEVRTSLKDPIKEKYGYNLTYMPFFIKAAVFALKEFPVVNASIVEDKIIYKKYYNIGVAVGRDSGLIVPVIKNADQKNILQLAQEVNELSQKAHTDKLTLDEVHGGTFTITNAGMFGATASTPIINYPEVAILGVHMIQKRPVVRDNQIVIRDMMTLTLSLDHRLVDGHIGVQFLRRLIYFLKNPHILLINLE